MKTLVGCRTHAEYDACIKAGNIAIVFGLRVTAPADASVEAWENSSVVAWGNSSVVARENSSVEAWGNSSVEAWGNVVIRLFSALKVHASAYVAVFMHGKATSCVGGRRLKCAPFPKTVRAWANYHGAEVEDDYIIVYKGVDDDYSTGHAREHGIYYKVGTSPEARYWDKDTECGGGLHFSPRPAMTLEFNAGAKRFLKCRIKIGEARAPRKSDDYPHKIKAQRCEVITEVDRHGRAVKTTEMLEEGKP